MTACPDCQQDHGGLIPWHTIEPSAAVDLDLSQRKDIDGPRNKEGEMCPWPWGPQQLIGAPFGQYHCDYCNAVVIAGAHHPDYRGMDHGVDGSTRQLVTISCETTALTTLPDALLDDLTISPFAKVVYWYLKRHGGRTSVRDLALAMENCTDVMWRCLADLERNRWISAPGGDVDDTTEIQFTVHKVPNV